MPLNLEKFKNTLLYETTGTVNSMLMNIAELRRLDTFCEKKQKNWNIMGGISLALAVLLGIGGAVASNGRSSLPTLLLVVAGIALVAAVAGFIIAAIYGRTNFENRRYEMVAKVLGLIGKDMGKDAVLRIRLDLKKPNHKSKYVRKGQVRDWKVKYFVDPWLVLRGRFLDGTAFALAMTEKFQERSKWKTNARGKMKHKSKTKSASEASLQLKPKQAKYRLLGEIKNETAGAVQLPEGVELKGINASEKSLSLKVGLRGTWDASAPGQKESGLSGSHLVAMMFLSLYQVLNLARAMGKGQSRARTAGGAPGSGPAPAAPDPKKSDPFAF